MANTEGLSSYQKEIITFFKEHPKENMIVNALAGSGKTYTILKMLEDTKTSDIYVAFNNSIAEECRGKIKNPKVKVSTLHALGLSFIKYNIKEKNKTKSNDGGIGVGRLIEPEVDLDNLKIYKIIDSILGRAVDFEYKLFLRENYSKLYNLCRLTCTRCNNENDINRLVDKHGLFIDYTSDKFVKPTSIKIATVIEEIDKRSKRMFDDYYTIDFTDMLYIPFIKISSKEWGVPYWGYYTNIVNDEAQDTCALQLRFLKFIRRNGGRYVFVGDSRQAIYFWAGSDAASFESINQLYAPLKSFDLPINYRCPASHLSLVNEQFGIPIIPCEDAPDGEIKKIEKKDIIKYVKPKDMIISRKNKWLSEVIVTLIRKGIPVYFEDKEFVNNIKTLLKSYEKKATTSKMLQTILKKNIDNFEKELMKIIKSATDNNDKTKNSEVSTEEKEKATNFEEKIEQISISNTKLDNMNFIYGILVEYNSKNPTARFMNFYTYLMNLISSSASDSVRISSVHKAKGLEAPNVFVLNEGKVCKDFRNCKEQNQQESNLSYISFTRSKGMLYLVKEKDA